jgi:hypothetical protein
MRVGVLCIGQPPLAGKELVGGRERGGHGVELEHRLGRTARLATGEGCVGGGEVDWWPPCGEGGKRGDGLWTPRGSVLEAF